MESQSPQTNEKTLVELLKNFNELKKSITDESQRKTLEDEVYKAYNFLRLTSFGLEKKIHSLALIRVEKGYYDLTLEQRRAILKAPTIHYLCKSLIMENTAFQKEFESPYYQRYYCIVIQYTSEVNSEKIAKAMRDYQNANCEQKLGKRSFHFRLVQPDVSYQLTGYDFNGVAPLCLQVELPIILSHRINELTPRFFFAGGGDIDVKIRISTDEFLTKTGYNICIADIVDDTNYN